LLIFCIVRRRIHKELPAVAGWLSIFLISVFFITPYSYLIWTYLPIINNAGSQRLLIPVAFYTSILAGFLVFIAKRKTWLIYLLILFAIGTTILNWGNRRTIPTIDDANLKASIPFGTTWADTHFYALSKWTNPKQLFFAKIPTQNLEVIKGKTEVKDVSRSATLHIYEVDVQSSAELKENTVYFPGWTATFDSKPVLLVPNNYGVITLSLPKGKGDLVLSYQDLPLFQLSKIISVLSLIIIIFYSATYFAKKRFKFNSKVLSRD
jgi:hypothetical protein